MTDGLRRNPWTFVLIVCIALLAVAIGALVYQPSHPELNLTLLFQTSIGMFASIIVVAIGVLLRSHTTQQTDEAKSRREAIYQPLYDELLRIMDTLKSCRTASLPKWKEISDSSLIESVAPEVTEAMRNLVQELEKYGGVWKQSLFVAGKMVYSVLQEQLNKVTRNPNVQQTELERGSSWNRIYETIMQDYRFLFDPNYVAIFNWKNLPIFEPKQDHNSSMGRILAELLPQAGYYVNPGVIQDLLQALKAAVSTPGVTARATAAEKLMSKAEAARILISQRLKRPLT